MHVVKNKVGDLSPINTKPKARPSINAVCSEFAFVFDCLTSEITSLDALHERPKFPNVSIISGHYYTRARNTVVTADNTDTVSSRDIGNMTFTIEPSVWHL